MTSAGTSISCAASSAGFRSSIRTPPRARSNGCARRGKLVGVRHLISNEPDPRWLLQETVIESLGSWPRRGWSSTPFPSLRAIRIRARNRGAIAGAQDRAQSSWPAADPGAGLGAVGDPDRARRRAPQNVDKALDRSRRDHALALVDATTFAVTAITYSTCSAPNRVMAASNWPVILLGASYVETWRGITSLLADLSADAKRDVLGETARRIYRL